MSARNLKELEPEGTPPGTSAEDAGMRRQVLLSAAALFAERGYHATRIRDIAEAAGLSKPALYHYVRSKDELLFDLLMETLGEYLTGAREVIDSENGGPRATLAALVSSHLHTLLSKRTSIAFTLLETRALGEREREAVGALRNEYAELIRRMLRDGQDQHVLRDDYSETGLSLALSSLLNGTLQWEAGDLPDTDTLAEIITNLYLQGAQTSTSRGQSKAAAQLPYVEIPWAELSPDLAGDVRHVSGTWARILDTGVRLFRRDGYLATTTRDLAQESGLGNSTLYHHVADKEELLFLICLQSLKELIDVVVPKVVGIDEPIECLQMLVRSHTDVALTNADRFTVMLTEYRHLSGLRREQIADLRERYTLMVEGIVSRGQRSGRIRADVDSRILTRLLLGQVNWTTLWYSPEGKWKPADISDMLFEVGLRGAAR